MPEESHKYSFHPPEGLEMVGSVVEGEWVWAEVVRGVKSQRTGGITC